MQAEVLGKIRVQALGRKCYFWHVCQFDEREVLWPQPQAMGQRPAAKKCWGSEAGSLKCFQLHFDNLQNRWQE